MHMFRQMVMKGRGLVEKLKIQRYLEMNNYTHYHHLPITWYIMSSCRLVLYSRVASWGAASASVMLILPQSNSQNIGHSFGFNTTFIILIQVISNIVAKMEESSGHNLVKIHILIIVDAITDLQCNHSNPSWSSCL